MKLQLIYKNLKKCYKNRTLKKWSLEQFKIELTKIITSEELNLNNLSHSPLLSTAIKSLKSDYLNGVYTKCELEDFKNSLNFKCYYLNKLKLKN